MTIVDPTTFTAPFDAVPDSTAANIYFTGMGVTDGLGHVFSAKAASGATVNDVSGNKSGLYLPVGIVLSSDDNTAFVADLAAPQADGGESGGIYSVPAAGGSITELSGTGYFTPQGISLISGTTGSSDTIVFTGKDPATNKWGIFSVPPAGGAVTTILEGAPFVNTSSVYADNSGSAPIYYVIDNQGRGGSLYSVTGGAATLIESGLNVGFPAALIYVDLESFAIVFGQDPTNGADAINEIAGPGPFKTYDTPLGFEAGGGHIGSLTALNGAAVVDQTAGGYGAVFYLTVSNLTALSQ